MSHNTWTLFEEPYWLDSVAPGQWDAVEIRNGDTVVGRLPYVMRKKMNLTYIVSPLQTPTLGPWVRKSGAKYEKEVGSEHRILGELIQKLPSVSKCEMICAPEFTNLMAFHWAGYQLGLSYTYRIDDFLDMDALWERVSKQTRTICRRASKQVVVNTEPDFASVLHCIEKTYQRQKLDARRELEILEKIEDGMSRRNQRKMFIAIDAQDRVHAAYYCVFDERHTFALAGGADPELRQSGAQSLTLWEAIKDTPNTSKVFDFCGTMMPTIEPFIRKFGGKHVPKYVANKETSTARALAGINSAVKTLSNSSGK